MEGEAATAAAAAAAAASAPCQPLDSLPAAALSRVLDALPPRDLLAVAQTCRALRALADEDARWRAACLAARRTGWTHPFWLPPQGGLAAGSWKAAWLRRAALAARVDRVLVSTADGSLHALSPHAAGAATQPAFPPRACAARRDVPPAWCPLGARCAYVTRDGHIAVATLRRDSGALALTLRLRLAEHATPIYVMWAHDGTTLTWLAAAPGQALALHALHVAHAEPEAEDADDDDEGLGALRVLTSDDALQLTARGAPFFYDLSPAADVAAAHLGLGAQRGLALTPFEREEDGRVVAVGVSGAPAPMHLLPLLFAPPGAPNVQGSLQVATVHGFAAASWFLAPAFSRDGRFVFCGQMAAADVHVLADAGDTPPLAVAASRVGAPHGAPAVARWRVGGAAAQEGLPGGGAGCMSFAPSPDGRCLALLDCFGALRIEHTRFLAAEAAEAQEEGQVPQATRECGGAAGAPPLFSSDAAPGVGGDTRVVTFTWAPLRTAADDDVNDAPPAPPRLLLLLARHTAGGVRHRWAVWAPPPQQFAAAAAAAPPLPPHNALIYFPSPPGMPVDDADEDTNRRDGDVALSEAFMRSFVPFADQMWRGARLWSPAGDAFCYAARAAGAPQLGACTVWVQRVAEAAQQQAPRALCTGELAVWSPC
jgi:hypothetical protein